MREKQDDLDASEVMLVMINAVTSLVLMTQLKVHGGNAIKIRSNQILIFSSSYLHPSGSL